jgi:hypothetical protein
MYRRGLADKVLVSVMDEVERVAAGASPSDTELNRTALLKLGVRHLVLSKILEPQILIPQTRQ